MRDVAIQRAGQFPLVVGARLLLDGNEFASLNATTDVLLDLPDTGVSVRPLQCVSQNRPLLHDGFALQIPIARERDGRPRGTSLVTLVVNMMRAPVLGALNDLGRLVAKPVSEVLVPLLHLFM